MPEAAPEAPLALEDKAASEHGSPAEVEPEVTAGPGEPEDEVSVFSDPKIQLGHAGGSRSSGAWESGSGSGRASLGPDSADTDAVAEPWRCRPTATSDSGSRHTTDGKEDAP